MEKLNLVAFESFTNEMIQFIDKTKLQVCNVNDGLTSLAVKCLIDGKEAILEFSKESPTVKIKLDLSRFKPQLPPAVNFNPMSFKRNDEDFYNKLRLAHSSDGAYHISKFCPLTKTNFIEYVEVEKEDLDPQWLSQIVISLSEVDEHESSFLKSLYKTKIKKINGVKN